MRPIQRVILYLFPLYLTGMEQLIRTIFSAEAFSVSSTASSISVGGLALLLPLLVPSPITEGLSAEVLGELATRKRHVYNASDQNISISAWFFLVTLTFLWIFSLSKLASERSVFDFHGHNIAVSALIAFLIYLIGIVHTEIKERGE